MYDMYIFSTVFSIFVTGFFHAWYVIFKNSFYINELEEELKTEREGNDFYGTPEIYLRGEHFYQAVITTDFGDLERTDLETNIIYQVAGKKAREIISKRKVALE